MKQIIFGKFMGVDIILFVDFPEELKERENKQLDLAKKELNEILRKTYNPTNKEIDEIVKNDLNLTAF